MSSDEHSVYCPACGINFKDTEPCEHYKKYNWKPGENQQFFIKLIAENYEVGSFMSWKKNRKSIGTSVGNTRTKDTRCKWPGCSKDLNHMSHEKIEKHIEEHKLEEAKQKGQSTL